MLLPKLAPARRVRRIAVAAAVLAVALVRAPALSNPGQMIAQFQAWAKANPALHGVSKQQMNQMTALPYFTATFHAGSTAGTFLASVGADNTVSDESVAVDTASQTYDILKHLDVAAALVEAVYGSTVANDFKTAAQVGRWTLAGQSQATTLYRGKFYGYEATYHFVELIPSSHVDAEAKRLAGCAKSDCGD
jgi:hypothetical protein